MSNSKYFRDPSEKFIQIPNEFFDELMPLLPPAAFKIVCLIYRKTRGWNKDIDRISISQIVNGTGIKSDRTVRNALKYLKEEGFISVYEDGSQTLSYSLNMRGKIDRGKNYRSTPVKITAVNQKTPVKITNTKDISLKDKNTMAQSAESDFSDLFSEPIEPGVVQQPKELDDNGKAHLQVFGVLPDDKPDPEVYAVRQELQTASWEIQSSDVELAIVFFVLAVRNQHPGFKLPNDTSSRKRWYKSVNAHLQNYMLSELRDLYRRAIIKMDEKNLSYWVPGSLTNWGLPEVANETQSTQDIDISKGFYV